MSFLPPWSIFRQYLWCVVVGVVGGIVAWLVLT